MKHRLLLALTAVVILFLLLETECFAEVSVPDLSGIADEGIITEEEASGKSDISLWDKLMSGLSDGLTLGIPLALKLLGLSAGVLVMSSSLRSASSLSSSNISGAVTLVSSLSLCIAVYPTCLKVFSMVAAYIKTLSQLMTGLTGAVTAAYVMGGNVSVASTNAASMYLLGNIIDVISSGALMPFLSCAVGISLAGAVPDCADLTHVSAFLRGTVNTVMAFVFTVFSFAVFMQNSVAAAGDTLAYRTARFASGTFIPVIGAMIGDASRTVAGSISAIKGTVGLAGTSVVIAVMLPPIIASLCCRMTLHLSSALASVLGCSHESRFLSELSGLMGIIFALCTGISAVMLINLAMFIKMEVTV